MWGRVSQFQATRPHRPVLQRLPRHSMPAPRDSGPLTMISDPHAEEVQVAAVRRRFSLGLGGVMFGAYLLFTLLVAAALWALIAQDRQRQLERQENELAGLARVFQEHAANTFGNLDGLLDAAARQLENFERSDDKGNPSRREELRARVAAQLARVPTASAISLADAQGQPVLALRDAGLPASIMPPPPQPATWLNNPNAPMRIGHPLAIGKLDASRWQLPVERAAASSGQLFGVIGALINLRHFAAFYGDVGLDPEDKVMLISNDGTVLLHHPFQTELIGSNLAGSPLLERPRDERAVVFNGQLRLDEDPRLIAVRRLPEHPVLVVVSRPLDVAMRDFVEMRKRLIVGASLLLSLLLALITLAYRDIRRREADRAELRRINASLEARVGRRTAELEQTNRELLAFSYSVSHDLRTPLRAINGFAHALREDYQERLDDAGRDFLDRIYRASVRMGELIDELLSLANVSRQPLSFGDIDFSAMTADVADDLKLADPHRVVHVDIQPGMRIEGDEALLRNALTNLLGNAWKFTRSRNPAFISITARDEGDRVRYTVGDNGVGFDMAHAKRLFQPFQQLHGDQGYGGTGIGLASVRRIIERHGGRIWAESAPERGARFIFELPKRMAVLRRRRS